MLQYTEAERPAPGEGKVLIEVRFAGVSYADTMRRRNQYVESQNLPFVPGSEVAGTVAEVEEGVEKSQPTTGKSTCSAWADTSNTPCLSSET